MHADMGTTSVVGLSVLHRLTTEGLMQFNLLELLCQFLIDWLTYDLTTPPGKMLKLCSLNIPSFCMVYLWITWLS